MRLGEDRLPREGAGQAHVHTPHRHGDLRRDLEQLHAQRAGRGVGERGAAQADRTEPLDQVMGKTGQEQPDLVGSKALL